MNGISFYNEQIHSPLKKGNFMNFQESKNRVIKTENLIRKDNLELKIKSIIPIYYTF